MSLSGLSPIKPGQESDLILTYFVCQPSSCSYNLQVRTRLEILPLILKSHVGICTPMVLNISLLHIALFTKIEINTKFICCFWCRVQHTGEKLLRTCVGMQGFEVIKTSYCSIWSSSHFILSFWYAYLDCSCRAISQHRMQCQIPGKGTYSKEEGGSEKSKKASFFFKFIYFDNRL